MSTHFPAGRIWSFHWSESVRRRPVGDFTQQAEVDADKPLHFNAMVVAAKLRLLTGEKPDEF
ncbi:MAG TPA: hypothetical protein VN924_32235 [Bryobacteraceae bacterium]|nr:hypothetical protein [Bryobacteraceae bacterium]